MAMERTSLHEKLLVWYRWPLHIGSGLWRINLLWNCLNLLLSTSWMHYGEEFQVWNLLDRSIRNAFKVCVIETEEQK